jgi:hypothetical protein
MLHIRWWGLLIICWWRRWWAIPKLTKTMEMEIVGIKITIIRREILILSSIAYMVA